MLCASRAITGLTRGACFEEPRVAAELHAHRGNRAAEKEKSKPIKALKITVEIPSHAGG
jgi:hypothetical protein